jgi:hypothetical protein
MVRRWIIFGALAGALSCASDDNAVAAASTCVYEQQETQPYMVLGSLVEPSSSIIIVGACGSSFDALNAEYVEAAPNRGTAQFRSSDCTRRTSTRTSVTCAEPRFD